MALKLFKMETIKITTKEYSNLLKIAYASEFFLESGLPSTKQRLTEYLNEFKNQ